jgi:hypothetical protein
MQATFSLTDSDFARLQKIVSKRLRSSGSAFTFAFVLRVLVWMCIGSAGAAYVRVMQAFPEASPALESVAVLLVIAVIAIVATPYAAQSAFRRQMLAPDGAFLSEQTVSLSDSHLRVTSARGTTEIPWSGFLARADDEVNCYLFIDRIQALVLPRSATSAFGAKLDQYTVRLKNAA